MSFVFWKSCDLATAPPTSLSILKVNLCRKINPLQLEFRETGQDFSAKGMFHLDKRNILHRVWPLNADAVLFCQRSYGWLCWSGKKTLTMMRAAAKNLVCPLGKNSAKTSRSWARAVHKNRKYDNQLVKGT